MSEDHTPARLAPVGENLVDRMEDAVFAGIAADRSRLRARRRRNVIGWTSAAAAAVVVAAVAVPLAVTAPVTSAADQAAGAPEIGAADGAATGSDGVAMSADDSRTATGYDTAQVITTASIDLQADDLQAAAEDLAAYAASVDGFVESQSIGGADAATEYPEQYVAYSYVSLRVPADALADAQSAIATMGTVLSSSQSRTDVTANLIDLDAQVDAARAAVDRLTELVAQAENVSDLIAAESALADRQATLQSAEAQRDYLADQVAMSTVTVNLTTPATANADPAGFGSGLIAGWNGLITSLNAVVVAAGFAVPWLAVVAVIVVIVWLVRRGVRAKRARADE